MSRAAVTVTAAVAVGGAAERAGPDVQRRARRGPNSESWVLPAATARTARGRIADGAA